MGKSRECNEIVLEDRIATVHSARRDHSWQRPTGQRLKAAVLTTLIALQAGGCGQSQANQPPPETIGVGSSDATVEGVAPEVDEGSDAPGSGAVTDVLRQGVAPEVDEGSDASTMARADSVDTSVTPYRLGIKTSDGFKMTATLSMTKAVLGNNTDAVDAMWSSVGGSGDAPCFDEDYGGNGNTAKLNQAVVAFGTLKIQSLTQGFAPPTVELMFIEGKGDLGYSKPYIVGLQYASGVECDEMVSSRIIPKMVDDTWGPVPVVIFLMNGRTPAMPNGPAALPTFYLHYALDPYHLGREIRLQQY